MHIEIITTAGAADANSYADVDYADTYFTRRTNGAAWVDDADEEAKMQNLLDAMPVLEALGVVGRRIGTTQALNWPRQAYRRQERWRERRAIPSDGLFDKNGRFWPSDEVPTPLMDAQCEIAFILHEQPTVNDVNLSEAQVKSFATDGVSISFGSQTGSVSRWEAGTLPPQAQRILAPFLHTRELAQS